MYKVSKLFVFTALVAVTVIPSLSGCSGKRTVSKPLSFESSAQPAEVVKLWTKKLPGPITDLNLSKNGNAILIATIPDADADASDKSSNRYMLTRFDGQGKQVWNLPLKSQIKSQAISDDGDLIVAVNYSNEVTALDKNGKSLWTVEGSCKPIILSQVSKVICHHDDDTRPEVAFEVYDFKGKRLHSFPVTQDVLALKVSSDEKSIALGLTGGRVVLLSDQFKKLKDVKVKGEILDLAVTWDRKIAVLHNSIRDGQRITLIDSNGKVKGNVTPSAHVEQLEISPSEALRVYAYGNSPKGQHVLMFEGDDLKPRWQKSEGRYADYSSSILATEHMLFVGFEDVEPDTRHSHLVAFDSEGKMRANVLLETEEGAYLYSYSFSPAQAIMAVGTDDSTLTVYQFN